MIQSQPEVDSYPPDSGRQHSESVPGSRLVLRWKSLLRWLELIHNLAVRDVETRYKHSLLGLYWTIINPLVTAGIFGFVFGVIFHATAKGMPYVVFVIVGLTFWNFFANGAMSATGCITGSAALLAKLYFPRVVLPTAAVMARLIDFAFSLVVLVFLVVLYRVPVHWTAIGLIPVVVIEIVFTLGVSYALAALNVLYRDMSQIIGLVLMVWMWVTPVMYAVSTVPTGLQSVLLLNPMGGIVEAQRNLLFTGRLGDPSGLWAAAAWAAFAFVGGLALFKRIEPLFAEVM